MTKFKSLNICYQTAIVSGTIIIIGFLSIMFLFWQNYGEVPLSVLAGGLIASISYLFLGIFSKEGSDGKKPIVTIIIQIVRFVLLGGAVIVAALLTNKLSLIKATPIIVAASYLVAPICLVVLSLLNGRSKDGNIR